MLPREAPPVPSAAGFSPRPGGRSPAPAGYVQLDALVASGASAAPAVVGEADEVGGADDGDVDAPEDLAEIMRDVRTALGLESE